MAANASVLRVAVAGLCAAAGIASADPLPPTILADSALKPALDAIASAFAAKNGIVPTLVYGASGALAKKIAAGVPVDVVLASDLGTMRELEAAHLINGRTRQPIIGNDLVLIAPAESKLVLKILPGFDLLGALGGGKLAICAFDLCPAGLYARQSLDRLKVWTSVQAVLVEEGDGGSALALVAGGKAPLGIVYATEAKAEPKVRILDTFPTGTHDPIIFPIALASATKNPDAARFEAFMRSGEATRILLGQGFAVLK